MIMPLHDDNTGRRLFPFVNYALIAANIFVFVVLQGMGANDDFTYAFSAVPYEIMTGKDLDQDVQLVDRQGGPIIDPQTRRPAVIPHRPVPISVFITLITSIFMHGGLAHLLGNMLFLWIFGDNVEDDLGHARYLAFYLVTGILASLAHVFTTVILSGVDSFDARIPSLGASGAISAVLGGYILNHPRRQVLVLMFRFVTWVPAYVAIGIWFAFQLIEGLGMLGGMKGGVAYGAHIGGFLAGLALIKVFGIGLKPRTTQADMWQEEPWDEQHPPRRGGRW